MIDIKAGLKLKSLNKINCSSLNINASHVHKIHKTISIVIAKILLE